MPTAAISHTMLEDLAEFVVDRIRRNTERRFLIKRLSENCKALPEDIQTALEIAREWGYRIQTGTGWCQFQSAPDALLRGEILFHLQTKRFGAQLHSYQQVKSTNTIAARLAEDGAPEGTVVIADQQTAGRGRLGRNWHSPSGVGAYVSIILRPCVTPSTAPSLSIVTALAFAEAVEALTGLSPQVKWPNDALIKGRKVCGILTELATTRENIEYVIVGVGMNLNHTREQFPSEIRDKAGSVRLALGRKVNRPQLVCEFLQRFEKRYDTFLKRGFVALRPEVKKRSSLIGGTVQITGAGGSRNNVPLGVAIDIDETGRLIVQTETETLALSSGEVSLAENYQRR